MGIAALVEATGMTDVTFGLSVARRRTLPFFLLKLS
jgi:hypothetical protein